MANDRQVHNEGAEAAGIPDPQTHDELFQLLNQQAFDFIRLHQLNGKSIYASHSVKRFYGLEPTELFQFAHPDDMEVCREWWQQLVRNASVGRLRWRVRDGSGKWRWLETSASLVHFMSDPHILTVCRDVSEHVRAENLLRDNQQLLNLVIKTLPVGVVVTDCDGNIVLSNEMSALIWGELIFSGRERWVRSTAFWHDSPDRIQPEDWASVRALSRGETTLKELLDIEGFDGQRRTIENSAAPLRDGNGSIMGAVVVNTDVTERVRAEAALRESERKLKEAEHIAHVGFWENDLIADRIIWSDETCRILGLPPGHVPRNLMQYRELIHPDDRAMQAEVTALAQCGEATYDVEYRVVRSTGEVRNVHSIGHVICDESGRPKRAFGVVKDITERKRSEEQLRTANEELRALAARVNAIREEESTRIAREIHDELGSALTRLRWDLHTVERLITEECSGTGTGDAVRRIQSMQQLASDTVSAIRRIASELRPSLLDDFGIADALQWQAEQFQARTGIPCRYICTSEMGDLRPEQATAIFRIVQEALTNVLRHAQATMVTISVRTVDNQATVAVSDNGRGMSEHQLGQRSLGLLGMRERAHLAGGRLQIESKVGQGTNISIILEADSLRPSR